MKRPLTPPNPETILTEIAGDMEKMKRVFSHMSPETNGRYYHWEILKYFPTPEGISTKEWWMAIKFARRSAYKPLFIKDFTGSPFKFVMTDSVLSMLHDIDKRMAGTIQGTEPITNQGTRDTYLVKSLIQEATRSSQLEGATTTQIVAKNMILTGREPRNKAERMIWNNYQAMFFIRSIYEADLTPKIICKIHSLLTVGTLKDPSAVGRFRREDEPIVIEDAITGKLLHQPPPASKLPARIATLCEFANETDKNSFMHPVIRAIVLHFLLGYDHPFVDGNGRTARALFYWAMAKHGYWLNEYVSISNILCRAPSKYAMAYLYTETDENDLTYFIIYHLKALKRAIDELYAYLGRKSDELRETRQLIQEHGARVFNHRQLAVLHNAMENPQALYSVVSHKTAHGITKQTARTDLMELSSMGLLMQTKMGRMFVFSPPRDLKKKLVELGHPVPAVKQLKSKKR